MASEAPVNTVCPSVFVELLESDFEVSDCAYTAMVKIPKGIMRENNIIPVLKLQREPRVLADYQDVLVQYIQK